VPVLVSQAMVLTVGLFALHGFPLGTETQGAQLRSPLHCISSAPAVHEVTAATELASGQSNI